MSKHSQAWVAFEKVQLFLELEPALIILGMALGAWVISKIILTKLPENRKERLRQHFRNLIVHLFFGCGGFLLFEGLERLPYTNSLTQRFMTYLGLATIFSGMIIFVKVCRILLFEYLYVRHRKVAFPLLLVNIFTFLLYAVLATWIGAEIFNFRLAPILATSAIFSLVLGLALQDTLGNLFAGVALQFDKPYEIGDWVEIQTSGQKKAGQVVEISWRATLLLSTTDESIIVPNRIIAQAEVSNFSTKYRPIIRSHIFRLAFGVNIQDAKDSLLKAIKTIPEIRKNPPPKVFLFETTESWVGFRLIYHIDDYGSQFRITDQVLTRCLNQLAEDGFELSQHRITLTQVHETAQV